MHDFCDYSSELRTDLSNLLNDGWMDGQMDGLVKGCVLKDAWGCLRKDSWLEAGDRNRRPVSHWDTSVPTRAKSGRTHLLEEAPRRSLSLHSKKSCVWSIELLNSKNPKGVQPISEKTGFWAEQVRCMVTFLVQSRIARGNMKDRNVAISHSYRTPWFAKCFDNVMMMRMKIVICCMLTVRQALC